MPAFTITCELEFQTTGQGAKRKVQFRASHAHPVSEKPWKWNDHELRKSGLSQDIIELAAQQESTGGQWRRLATIEFDWDTDGELGPQRIRIPGKSYVEQPLAEEELPSGFTRSVAVAVPPPPGLSPNPTALNVPPAVPAAASAPQEGEFHNPYNFIATPPRRCIGPNPLADGEPAAWDRYHPDLYSGWIDVDAVAATPLLINDPDWVSDHHGHKTAWKALRVRGTGGGPTLPVTGLRGMLSAAYELATHSRWRVFHKRDRRLAKRMAAEEALGTVPFRVVRDQEGRLCAQLLLGTSTKLPTYLGEAGQLWKLQDKRMFAAFVPNYDVAQALDLQSEDHGREVWAWLCYCRHRDRPFSHWMVLQIADERSKLSSTCPELSNPRRISLNDPAPIRARGWLCVTNRNVGMKKYERFFFHHFGDQVPLIPLEDGAGLTHLGRSWGEVIQAYRDAHQDAEIWGRRFGGPAVAPNYFESGDIGKTAWSGHIYRDGSPRAKRQVSSAAQANELDWAELREATLGYALLDRDGRLKSLIPVHIARFPFSNSPLAQLHPTLRPAASRRELSPADRVFGWVPQSGKGAHRGQLRIRSVTCLTPDKIQSHNQPIPLAILSTPKPKQVAFYLAKDELGNPLDSTEIRDADFSQNRSLRGPKVYPHHAHLPQGYWDVPHHAQPSPQVQGRFREYLRAGRNRGPNRDSQNRSVCEWVEPGATFRFRIQVTNLNKAELGALVWLLRLHTPDAPYHFRFGGGKPLGFGSLQLSIHAHQLSTGTAIADGFRKLDPTAVQSLDESALDKVVGAYQEALLQPFEPGTAVFEQLPMIAGLLCAGRGWPDSAPVHYPRTTRAPDADGNNYEWFAQPRPLPSLTSPHRLRRT